MPGGPGHYELPNSRPPELVVHQMPGVCPRGGGGGGGMLAVGIDSHIIFGAGTRSVGTGSNRTIT